MVVTAPASTIAWADGIARHRHELELACVIGRGGRVITRR
jgi:2-keto-4-pentenoate hydratase/2-oxohepta-3-ene-1,7-dioic acid hydratase in catechol pathway